MKKGFWNYRVVKCDNFYSINEVTYDHQGNLEFIDNNPTIVRHNSIEDLKSMISLFIICLEEPVLDKEIK